MILQGNSEIFDLLQGFSDIAIFGFLADLPIFFLPIFLTGMWIYYTFGPHTTFFQREKGSYKMQVFSFLKKITSGKKPDKRLDLLHIFYACVLGLIFSYIIKFFVDIERPESYLEQTGNLIMSTIPAKSFPSDHATVSFAFTISLFFAGYKKVGYIFLPCIIVMNISRIIAGVHWPLDILAGMIVGIAASVIIFRYMMTFKLVKTLDIFIISIMKKLRLY